jgi:hypothetical protein
MRIDIAASLFTTKGIALLPKDTAVERLIN